MTLLRRGSDMVRSSTTPASRGAKGPADPLEVAYWVRHEKVLGAGTDSCVVRGVLRNSGEWRALKLIHPRSDAAEREVETLRVANMENHPNVVRLLEVYHPTVTRHTTVLAYPIADCDLCEFLGRRAGRVSDAMARSLAVQLGKGLAHLHNKRILHRDLKPANLLITIGDAGRMMLQISDFSRSCQLPPCRRARLGRKTLVNEDQCPVNTRVPHVTPGPCTQVYSAPEIFFGPWEDKSQSCYGTAVDVWSYGCIVFELVAAEPLLVASSDARLVAECVRRVGPLPPGVNLGPRQAVLLEAAGQTEATATLVPKDPDRGLGWAVVAAALRWEPDKRPEVAKLLRDFAWLHCRDSAPAAPQGALAAPQGHMLDGGVAPDAGSGPKPDQGAAPVGQPMERSLPNLWQLGDPVKPPGIAKKRKPCSCSGHCYTQGHRYWGCQSKDLIEGSAYCIDCKCVVLACPKPRHHGPECYKHHRLIEALPMPLQFVRAAGAMATKFIPADMVDYVKSHPAVCHDPVLAILMTILEQPATEVLQAHIANLPRNTYSAQQLGEVLEDVVRSVAKAPHVNEFPQLSRQGLALGGGSCVVALPPI